jgi:non-ribosomal peptide synthetase component E (peptide arylation enzyme)
MAIEQREFFTEDCRSYKNQPLSSVVSKHQNDRVSYASLDARSNTLARGLESVGVRKGDRVGVMLGNSIEYAAVCEYYIHIRKEMLIDARQPTLCSNWGLFW